MQIPVHPATLNCTDTVSPSAQSATPQKVHKQTNTHTYLPPVFVELSVSKAEKLSGEVHRRVEEPVEKHQPQQVIRDLGAGTKFMTVRHLRGNVQTNYK